MKLTATAVRADKREVEKEFPKLMIYSDKETEFVVIMTGHGIGTVVDVLASKDWNLGDHFVSWSMDKFVNFYGTVTLKSQA